MLSLYTKKCSFNFPTKSSESISGMQVCATKSDPTKEYATQLLVQAVCISGQNGSLIRRTTLGWDPIIARQNREWLVKWMVMMFPSPKQHDQWARSSQLQIIINKWLLYKYNLKVLSCTHWLFPVWKGELSKGDLVLEGVWSLFCSWTQQHFYIYSVVMP